MHRSIRPAVLALAIAGSVAVLPTALEGQVRDWAVSVRGGYAIPIRGLGRAQNAGLTVGAGLERILERTIRRYPIWGLRLDVEVDRLPGDVAPDETELPEATFVRYVLGAEYWVTRDPNSIFSARARGAIGGSTLMSDPRPSGGEPGGTFATLIWGLSAGLSVVYVDAQWAIVFTGDRLGGDFGVGGGFATMHVLSFRAGVRIPM